ncbi:hypothetical protein [Tabrizicola sp.]|uniref:hypothetical protein n=1 Tax=Tabrizicola sp. TaxID=2005166 RepID=UPI003F3B8122
MHRLLCALTLALAPMAAQAETGPPTAEEVATAKAACAVEVRQDCLFALAVDAALAETRTAQIPYHLNQVAIVQARTGDVVGADRTLSLTEPEEGALLSLGRWDEAYEVAKLQFPNMIVEQGTPEGSTKNGMVRAMLKAGEEELALSTALSIPEGGYRERDEALRVILDHHLSEQDFIAARAVFDRMQERFTRDQALLSLVEAQTAAGLTAEATAMLNQTEDPRTQAQARLVLARALEEMGSTEAAKAQFDLIFASANGKDGLQDWGLSVLIDAADLALSLGETAVARQHAEAAFAVIDQDRKSSRPAHIRNASNPINLIRVATVLQLAGSFDKAATLFAEAALPPRQPEDRDRKVARLAELLLSHLRLQDREAADATLQELLLIGDGAAAWAANERLREVGLALVDYGFPLDAQRIAEQLETLPYAGGKSYAIYAALLAKDPALAPSLLPGIRSSYLHIEVSIGFAQWLHASGQDAKAQQMLQSLVIDHAGRSKDDYPLPSDRTRALSEIAKAQANLGFADDAAATRLRGLAFADMNMIPGLRVTALLSLADSFP